MLKTYLIGLDVIGAQAPNRALLIHITNEADVVTAQGGTMGTIAQRLIPDTIDDQVYSKMATQMKQKLAEQGVKADVNVVDMNTMKLNSESPIWKYATYGLAGALALGVAGYIVFGGSK